MAGIARALRETGQAMERLGAPRRAARARARAR